MRWIVPDFYEEFHCIAGQCSDSCCIGWEIDIDEESAERYHREKGCLGEKMNRSIEWGEPAHFVLTEDERCPFLNRQNLCELILQKGEESLCEICREHPRFHEWYGAWRESGIGLCCEEGCRLLLREERPLRFVEKDDGQPQEYFEGDERLLKSVLAAREKAYELWMDKSRPMSERRKRFLMEMQRLQDEWDGFPPAAQPEIPAEPTEEELLEYMQKLEPVDARWTALVNRMQSSGEPLRVSDGILERTAVYLTFRWLAKAAYDGDLMRRAEFIVEFMDLLQLILNRGAAQNAQEALRLLSKELEYME